jgi:putative membrane protein
MNRPPHLPPGHGKFLLVLVLLWLVFSIVLGIAPRQRADWLMEHIVVAAGLAILVVTGRWFVFSKTAYTLGFLFTCLHTIGAHYTYSEVPYLEAWASLTGEPIPAGGTRNHFDRIIHFLYGLMLTRPWREAFYFAMTPRRDFWSHLVVVSFSMATSLLYELFEWAAAVLWGGEAGMAFLGTQGDVWDAHKDMLLATIGSVLACVVMVLRRIFTGRDPACEWGESRRSFTTAPGAP